MSQSTELTPPVVYPKLFSHNNFIWIGNTVADVKSFQLLFSLLSVLIVMYIEAEVQKLVSLLVMGLYSDSDRNVTKHDKNEDIYPLACIPLFTWCFCIICALLE